jgi:hypothetical protein
MKVRALLILLMLAAAMVPIYYINRWLQQLMKPRDNVGRLFLFMLANFLLIIVYTVLVVGLIVRLIPR